MTGFLPLFAFLLLSACGGAPAPVVSPSATGWKVIGPGGGGSIFEPTVSPADPNHAFVRCDMTGSYVTVNGGESWRMFNLRTVVWDFEFDPNNPNTVYACNSGLYRSEDGGIIWRLIHPAPERIRAERMVGDHATQWFETGDSLDSFSEMQRVEVDPLDSDVIYVGWSAYRVYRDSLPALWLNDVTTIQVSEDYGAAFRTIARLPGHEVMGIFPAGPSEPAGELTVITDRACAVLKDRGQSVELLPLPSATVFAADGGMSGGSRVIYVVTPTSERNGRMDGGVFRSLDGGRSWLEASTGLDEGWKATGGLPYFNTIGVCESRPEHAYLSCRRWTEALPGGEKENRYGVLRTTDSGASWDWVYLTSGAKVLGDNHRDAWHYRQYGAGYTGNPHGIGVAPSDPEICYTTDYGRTNITRNGGKTWEQVYADSLPDGSYSSRGLDVTTCYGVHFDPFDKDHMFITYTDIGLFNSFNGGRGWVHSLDGVPERWWNTCYWLTFDPSIKDRVYSVWGNGHDLPRLKMFRQPGFTERFQGGVAVSDDGGRTWRADSRGIPENTVCAHILLDPDSPPEARVLYVCGTGRGVFKSTDSGRTWTEANNGLGRNLNSWQITLLPDGTLYLIVMRALDETGRTIPGELYVSRNAAGSWEKVALPAGVTGPNDLALDHSDSKRMYLSCWPLPVDRQARDGGVLRTTDGGSTWERIFPESAHVYALAVDPANNETLVINTFESAAFRSDDGGDTWRRLEGYNFKWGQRPIFDPHNPGMLYLTTFGGSVYHGPAAGVPGHPEDIQNDRALRWHGDDSVID